MKSSSSILSVLFLTILLTKCVKPVDPESIEFEDVLVVEALLTNEFKNQEVLLSRTYPIDKDTIRPESNAIVWIERNDGTRYDFYESAPGRYLSESQFEGNFNNTYHLLVKTSDDNEFQSEEVRLLKTVPIEDINAVFDPDNEAGEGVFSFFVNSASSEFRPNYLRWKWTETYKVQIPKPSTMFWDGTNLVRREDPKELQICYTHGFSSSVLVAASNLESGAIVNNLMTNFHSTTQKLAIRYSIEVHQMAISENSYNFWELIKSNSENQGGLFDSQPGTIRGNMHPIGNSKTNVLGIFEASEVAKLRKFYDQQDFTDQGYYPESRDIVNCSNEQPQRLMSTDEIPGFLSKYGDKYVPWYISSGMVDPPGILFISARCGDCRLYGNTEIPDFWID